MDGKFQMLTKHFTYQPQVSSQPLIFEVRQDPELENLFYQFSTEKSWGERKAAAQKLGYMRSQEAFPYLLRTLPSDPFWIMRYAIIQGLEKIGSPDTIPVLRVVAKNDDFQVIRSSAVKAIETLS
jgi:HEAT repeat protein